MRPSYRIVSYRIEKKTLTSYRYRIKSKKSLSLFIGWEWIIIIDKLLKKEFFFLEGHEELRCDLRFGDTATFFAIAFCILPSTEGSKYIQVIFILIKLGTSISTWFQSLPFCSQISELFLFLLYNLSFQCPQSFFH